MTLSLNIHGEDNTNTHQYTMLMPHKTQTALFHTNRNERTEIFARMWKLGQWRWRACSVSPLRWLIVTLKCQKKTKDESVVVAHQKDSKHGRRCKQANARTCYNRKLTDLDTHTLQGYSHLFEKGTARTSHPGGNNGGGGVAGGGALGKGVFSRLSKPQAEQQELAAGLIRVHLRRQ